MTNNAGRCALSQKEKNADEAKVAVARHHTKEFTSGQNEGIKTEGLYYRTLIRGGRDSCYEEQWPLHFRAAPEIYLRTQLPYFNTSIVLNPAFAKRRYGHS